MSRFSGVAPDGSKVVGVGLTEKTYREMLTGKVMVLNLGPLGIPNARMILIAGKDEAEIAARLNHKMNEETHIVLPVEQGVLRGADSK
jgi:hypothetical protein